MVFFQKNILIPNAAEKNILILVEEKKNNLIQSFCHITNVEFWKKSGKKFRFARQKKKYSNSRVVGKKNSERNKKP